MRALRRAGVLSATLLALGSLVVVGAVSSVADSTPTQSDSTDAAPAFTSTKTVTRTVVATDGSTKTVDSRSVTLNVDTTDDLKGRQRVAVSWSGAHPSSNRFSDPSDPLALGQEYPMVLLECRGTDSGSVPAAAQVSQQTCFTNSQLDRITTATATNASWRLDSLAAPADRKAVGPAAPPDAAGCPGLATNSAVHYLPFISATNTSYQECTNTTQPPEAGNLATSGGLVANEQFDYTAADGTGGTKFEIRTAEENASLGCSQTVACSLVAVPIMGISCDTSSAGLLATGLSPNTRAALATSCQASGKFAPGSVTVNNQPGNLTVTGQLWWSASNWANRISVPLTFAPAANVCDITDHRTALAIYGSELMAEAAQQWEPAFCLDPDSFKFSVIRLGEEQARTQVDTGGISAGLVSEPPAGGYNSPVAAAPVAISGFAIGYVMNEVDANGVYTHDYQNLQLTPRLLAKLISQSYNAGNSANPGVSGNPENMVDDPEFKALNPDAPARDQIDGTATLLSLNANTDVVHALTAYIDADPEARAFLDGTADPWGMKVNPAYAHIVLPVESIPLLDTVKDNSDSFTRGCSVLGESPYLDLVSAPVSKLFTSTQALLDAWPNLQTACKGAGTTDDPYLPGRIARPTLGNRQVLALTSLADAAQYGLDVASLQSSVDPDAPAKFSDATGRTFVAPNSDSMSAAMALATPDATTNTWDIPYGDFHATPEAAGAYPGTLPIYMIAPTTGLSAGDAAEIAGLMRFAAGAGQVPGTSAGDLPPGYLPMTDDNGLGAFLDYNEEVAQAVAGQTGVVPALVPVDVPAPQDSVDAPLPVPTAVPVAAAPPNAPLATPRHRSSPGRRAAPARAPAVARPAGPPEAVTVAPVDALAGVSPSEPPPVVVNAKGVLAPMTINAAQAVASDVRTPSSSSALSGDLLPALLALGLLAALASPLLTRLQARRRA